jgi:hypothetical protein
VRVWLLAALALAGCGEPRLGQVAVYRRVPDTLLVQVRPPSGLLARGPAPSELGSRTPVMVEVCGRFPGQAVCEQVPVAASPKRVRAAARIGYPAAADRERAVARVAVAFERHDGRRWQPMTAPPGLGFALRAWVDGAPGDAVTAPLVPGRDTVRLTTDPSYDAYWLRLNERAFFGEGARVHLALLARWPGGGEAVVARAVRTVQPPGDAERAAQVQAFARAAARGVARTLSLPPDSAVVRVEAWRFDRIRQRYALDLALLLRDTTGASVPLKGRLEVGETGQEAVFREAVTDSLRVPLVLRMGRL